MTVLLSGCGTSGPGGGEETAELFRTIHSASSRDPLQVIVDSEVIASTLGFGQATPYTNVVEGEKVRVRLTESGEAIPLVDKEEKIEAGKVYTYLVYDGDEGVTTSLTADETKEPEDDQFRIRFIHGASDGGDVDIFITSPDTDLDDATPVVAGAKLGDVSKYFDVNEGSYRIRVTEVEEEAAADTGRTAPKAGSVLYDSGAESFTEGRRVTFLLRDRNSSGRPLTASFFEDDF